MGQRIRFLGIVACLFLGVTISAEHPGFLLVTKDFGPGLNDNLKLTRMAVTSQNLSLTLIVADRPVTYLYDLMQPDQLVMLDRTHGTYAVLTKELVHSQAKHMSKVFKEQELAAERLRARLKAQSREKAVTDNRLSDALKDQLGTGIDALGPSVDTLDTQLGSIPVHEPLKSAQNRLETEVRKSVVNDNEQIDSQIQDSTTREEPNNVITDKGLEFTTARKVPPLRWMDANVKTHRWSCTKYVSQTGEQTYEELYTTPWFMLGTKPDDFKIFETFKQHFAPLFTFFSVSVVPGIGSREVWEETDIKGFPIKFVRFRDNKPYRTMQVLKAERQLFPEAIFEVQENYKPVHSNKPSQE